MSLRLQTPSYAFKLWAVHNHWYEQILYTKSEAPYGVYKQITLQESSGLFALVTSTDYDPNTPDVFVAAGKGLEQKPVYIMQLLHLFQSDTICTFVWIIQSKVGEDYTEITYTSDPPSYTSEAYSLSPVITRLGDTSFAIAYYANDTISTSALDFEFYRVCIEMIQFDKILYILWLQL